MLIFNEKSILIGGRGNVDLLRKKDTLELISRQVDIPLENFIMIGDTKYDMIDLVGLRIALNAREDLNADYTVTSMSELKEIFEQEL